MSYRAVHIYCGSGKGKTTAAVGLAVRMAGSGGKVAFFQFLKDNSSSERSVLKNVSGIYLINGLDCVKFTFHMTEAEKLKAREFYEGRLDMIEENSDQYDMIVLDEAIGAVTKNIVREERLLRFTDSLRGKKELVLTGREPSQELLDRADYITEMHSVRHPYESGIAARKGIEF